MILTRNIFRTSRVGIVSMSFVLESIGDAHSPMDYIDRCSSQLLALVVFQFTQSFGFESPSTIEMGSKDMMVLLSRHLQI